jgi:uncharacterized membrane protein
MTTGNEIERERSGSEAEPQIFSARLTPHRSLNRTGFLAVMLFLSIVSFVTGMVFLMMGAWPVLGFFGLDVLVIWWAFKVNFRAARASEEIVVTPSELRVRCGNSSMRPAIAMRRESAWPATPRPAPMHG